MPGLSLLLSDKLPQLSKNQPVADVGIPGPNIADGSVVSAYGTPSAANRSLVPIEYMYDFDAHKLYPNGFMFRRRAVDINTQVRNIALQALTS